MQWSRNNQENAIDQLFISGIHVQQNFRIGLQTVICFEGIQSFYFSAILILHLLNFEFITTFSLFFFLQSRSKSAFLVVALRVFCFPTCFLSSTRLLQLRRFWSQTKGLVNITDRCESFVWDVKIICQTLSRIVSPFLNIFMLKRYERALVGLGTFHSTCQN